MMHQYNYNKSILESWSRALRHRLCRQQYNTVQALIKVALRLVGAEVTQSVLYPNVVLWACDVRHQVDAASRPL